MASRGVGTRQSCWDMVHLLKSSPELLVAYLWHLRMSSAVRGTGKPWLSSAQARGCVLGAARVKGCSGSKAELWAEAVFQNPRALTARDGGTEIGL